MASTNGLPDSTLRLARLGQRFISAECDRLGTDHFRTRLALQPVHCLRGPDAVRLAYPGERVTRVGGPPMSTVTLLQDRGSVQTLDGPEHRQRKQMFIDLLSGGSARRLADCFIEVWQAHEPSWPRDERFLFSEAMSQVLTETALRWAGIDRPGHQARRWSSTLVAMIDNAGRLGPPNWAARIRRGWMEAWARNQVRRARLRPVDDSPLSRIAHHRDLVRRLLPLDVAAVELLNLLRPIVAIGHFVGFALIALYHHPEHRSALAAGDPAATAAFVSEVRRTAPFFPMIGVRAKVPFTWQGERFEAGDRILVDLYGTNHDPAHWPDPDDFRCERFHTPGGDADAFVPQGGGPMLPGHRCPGEDVTVMIMGRALERLVRLDHILVRPHQVDLRRAPGLPRGGIVLTLGSGPTAPVTLFEDRAGFAHDSTGT